VMNSTALTATYALKGTITNRYSLTLLVKRDIDSLSASIGDSR
jgi:hypothetical protein